MTKVYPSKGGAIVATIVTTRVANNYRTYRIARKSFYREQLHTPLGWADHTIGQELCQLPLKTAISEPDITVLRGSCAHGALGIHAHFHIRPFRNVCVL